MSLYFNWENHSYANECRRYIRGLRGLPAYYGSLEKVMNLHREYLEPHYHLLAMAASFGQITRPTEVGWHAIEELLLTADGHVGHCECITCFIKRKNGVLMPYLD